MQHCYVLTIESATVQYQSLIAASVEYEPKLGFGLGLARVWLGSDSSLAQVWLEFSRVWHKGLKLDPGSWLEVNFLMKILQKICPFWLGPSLIAAI